MSLSCSNADQNNEIRCLFTGVDLGFAVGILMYGHSNKSYWAECTTKM